MIAMNLKLISKLFTYSILLANLTSCVSNSWPEEVIETSEYSFSITTSKQKNSNTQSTVDQGSFDFQNHTIPEIVSELIDFENEYALSFQPTELLQRGPSRDLRLNIRYDLGNSSSIWTPQKIADSLARIYRQQAVQFTLERLEKLYSLDIFTFNQRKGVWVIEISDSVIFSAKSEDKPINPVNLNQGTTMSKPEGHTLFEGRDSDPCDLIGQIRQYFQQTMICESEFNRHFNYEIRVPSSLDNVGQFNELLKPYGLRLTKYDRLVKHVVIQYLE